jgi:hypothetical protein
MAGSMCDSIHLHLPAAVRQPMRSTSSLRLIFAVLVFMTAASGLSALATIEATVAGSDPNNWNVGSFGPGDVAFAGSDFTSSTVTGPNPTATIDVNVILGNPTMRIILAKNADESTTWNSTYTLWVYPLSSGTGSGGGNSLTWNIPTGTWTQITSAETQLCTVRRTRTGITVRLELRSLTVAAGTTSSTPSYTTTLNYRLYTN